MDLPFIPTISVLTKHHNRNAFSCGNQALDHYLQLQASQDIKRQISAVFVLQAPNQKDIIAFYALSSMSIDVGELTPAETRKLPKSRPIPCTLLGQFAVSLQWNKKGVAGWMLAHILHSVLKHSQHIASFALVVDAVDKDAKAYWQHCGFLPFPSTSNRLFMPMKTIRKWLSD